MEEIREMEIDIWATYEWDIGIQGLKDAEIYQYFEIDAFGIARKTKDNKIAYLFDANWDNGDIKEAKKDPRFAEVCHFICTNSDDGWSKRKTVAKFTGTFIDALEYIKKNFNPKNNNKLKRRT